MCPTLPRCSGVTESGGERFLEQERKLIPAGHPHVTSRSLLLVDIQRVWVEGRRGQKMKSIKDLKIDLAVKGDIQRLAGVSLLPDNEPGSQTNGEFQAKYQLP